ncbi:hypothetical protein DICPUDRAFT_25863 [Dictyostelium purpureum]|uniref:peptidylprolyl isomerase n=1 Tax=Dictyostelium purpureum TaxID=5786 RepID=F0Z7L3_DICPU|nr:uncharacterized protein DICPUDRAFT_25863 [Dictyostelium purpureum]EGC40037.1 hypothetical protein DICPUDRAFT_25863 [Dictyostelium purpureum]|eukprot:XP_003283386.1 hypothetical protein DICPUDRAFT_25863 [Dictyostelium purpureum]
MKIIICLLFLIGLLSPFNKAQDPVGPSYYNVVFTTTKGNIEIGVDRSRSPYGSDRFYQLVTTGFFTETAFFRVIQTPRPFVAQWGISGTPSLNEKWNITIPNDPIVPSASNVQGTISFAAEENSTGTCCRTTQLFINYGNNTFLDSMGFTSFGTITSGFDYAMQFYSQYGEEPDQTLIYEDGNSYLQNNFPLLDYLNVAQIISEEW